MKFYIAEMGWHKDVRLFPEEIPDRCDRGTIQKLAEYYHRKCGGWDFSGWPYTFVILDDDNREVVRYLVELEVKPIFYATEIPKPA